MRNPFLLVAVVAVLSGCKTTAPPEQPSADRFLDEQIASSAAAISQSQFRLQQTSAVRQSGLSPGAPAASKLGTAPAVSVSSVVKPTAEPVKVFASALGTSTLSAPPTPISTVPVEASAAIKNLAVPVRVTTAKVLPSTAVPPVVEAKIITPPKPLPEPWVVSSNDVTLRRALTKWVKRAGWQLVWDASVDVPINVDAKFAGDFNLAVKHLFQSLSAADVTLSAVLYSGNRVLRVTESGHRAQ